MADATDSLWAEISELAKDPSITTSPPAKPKKLPYNDKMRERLTLLSKYLEDVQGDFDDVALMPEWQQARDVIVRLQAYFVARSTNEPTNQRLACSLGDALRAC